MKKQQIKWTFFFIHALKLDDLENDFETGI